MTHSVALVIIDIVKSRTIHRRLWEEVGTKADSQYTTRIYRPYRQRIDSLLATHDGRLHDDTGDQIAAYFDHTQDAILFALGLQRSMVSDQIAVPEGCDCPHLQLHVAVGRGTMESAAYQKPGASKVGAFNELARILAITASGQILVTADTRESAGKIPNATWHEWDVVLPKEEDRVKVLELLWEGREPRRPKDMASVSDQALKLAEEKNQLIARNQGLEDENRSLKSSLTAALERMQVRGDTGDPQALAAIDRARQSGDLTQLDAALDAEWSRREKQMKEQFADMLDLCRESAAVAFMHGDIEKAKSRVETILQMAPDDLDATNRLGRIYEILGNLFAAEAQYRQAIELAGDDVSLQSWPLGNLGNIELRRGNLAEAERLYRNALKIDFESRNLEGRARHLGNLGVMTQTRGDLDEAELLLRESLDINRKLGSLEGQAIQLGNLGVIAKARGKLDEAETLHRESLEIERKLGHLDGQASDLGNLGLIARARGHLDEAEEFHRESLEINRKLGRLEGQANQLGNLGLIAEARGNLEEAERLHRESLEIEQKLGHLEGQANDLGNLGSLAKQRGDIDSARRLLTDSRDLFARSGMPHMVRQLQVWLDELPVQP